MGVSVPVQPLYVLAMVTLRACTRWIGRYRYTPAPVKASVEPLEGNKVKLSVKVDETEFDKAIDRAFRKLAGEVRIPGFRPGKAPRRVLEARFGSEVGRSQALQDALPDYYLEAVREHEVDAIAAPELQITDGEADGPVAFEAVVEVRPVVSVPGYGGLRVTIPTPEATDEEIDAQLERLRTQFAELDTVDRPAADGDVVTIDVSGSQDGEPIAQLTAEDYVYEVGSGAIFDEVDEHLRGATAGSTLEFPVSLAPAPDAEAQTADGDEQEGDADEPVERAPLDFVVEVKEVKQRVLPDLDDEFANDASEFETLAELRADLHQRLSRVKRVQAQMDLREKTGEALADLVEDEIPDALVGNEVSQRLNDLATRLQAQGMTLDEWVARSGRPADDIVAELRETATQAVRVDLALRAVADAEGIECADEDLEAEFAQVAERMNLRAREVRKQFERAQQVPAVRSDVRKRKAFDWLLERVEIVDEDGHTIDRDALVLEADVDGVGASEVDLGVDQDVHEVAPPAGTAQADENSEDDE
jgi:trigger factor